MRILIFHNKYKLPGGEDIVASREHAMLRQNGHDVELVIADNAEIQGFASAMQTAINTGWRTKLRLEWIDKLKQFGPDVVHVHNFFPLITPAIFEYCHSVGIPTVHTLHNFRLICPGGLLLRNGKICEECVGHSAHRSMLYGCYRESRIATVPVARMIAAHRKRGTWTDKVDRFIAVSEFVKRKFVSGGFPEEKILVKPNFVNEQDFDPLPKRAREGALFVGRLVPEKGILTLLDAWDDIDLPLTIVGDGPLRGVIRERANPMVTHVGQVSPSDIADEMSRAQFLIAPSEWYETFGLTIAEAYASRLPVIASRLGALEEIVRDNYSGLLFQPGSSQDLRKQVLWAIEHHSEMTQFAENGRSIFEAELTSSANYPQLISIYEAAIAAHSTAK